MNSNRLIILLFFNWARLLHHVWTCDLTDFIYSFYFIYLKRRRRIEVADEDVEHGETRGCVLPQAASSLLLRVRHTRGKRCAAGRASQAAHTRPACTPLIPQARGAAPASLHLIKREPRILD